MAIKFIVAVCLLGLVAAGDYEYNNPNASASSVVEAANQTDTTINESSIASADTNNPKVIEAKSNDQQNIEPLASTYQALPNVDIPPSNDFGYNYQAEADRNPTGHSPTYYPPAKYDYSYSVHDDYTGDIKMHSESRDGYYVRGSYSLVEPDGFKRIVTYTADDVNGFKAIVTREPYPAFRAPVARVKDSPAVKTETQHNLLESSDSYATLSAQDKDGKYQ